MADPTQPGPGPGADPAVVKALGLAAGAKRRRKVVRWVVLAALFALVAFVGVRCVISRMHPPAPHFETVEAAVGDLSVTVTATGTIEALSTVDVGAEVSGRLLKVHVDYNDRVEIGQVLAEIDPEQYQAAVEEARARLVSADAAVQQARATLTETKLTSDRVAAELARGLVAQKDVDAANGALARAKAGVGAAVAQADIARANLRSAESKLARTKIVSPISGLVLARLMSAGQTVTAGFQTPLLFKLAEDLRDMRLHVLVDEADVGRVREKATATFGVDAYPERTFESVVLSLRNEPRTSQNVVSYEAVLSVDNSELLLKPGMTATASIVCESHPGVILVPNAALRFTPPAPPGGGMFGRGPAAKPLEGPTVWTLEGTVPKPLSVKVGSSDGIRTEIREGLDEGTAVITDMTELAGAP